MNVQEYIDSEVAQGNTDIRIPDGLDSSDFIKMPAGISVTFPWWAITLPTSSTPKIPLAVMMQAFDKLERRDKRCRR
jgi:hypothetical protein